MYDLTLNCNFCEFGQARVQELVLLDILKQKQWTRKLKSYRNDIHVKITLLI